MQYRTTYEAIAVYQSSVNDNISAIGISELNKMLERVNGKIDRVDKISDSMLIYIISYETMR